MATDRGSTMEQLAAAADSDIPADEVTRQPGVRLHKSVWFAVAGMALVGGLLWAWAGDRSFPDVWNGSGDTGHTAALDLENLTNPPIHEHADFAVFLNGARLNFDDERYFSDEEKQLAHDVHIHPNRPNVVHKHRQNVTWSDFFASLGMILEDERFVDADGNAYVNDGTNTLKFYLNGVRVESLRHERITDLDRALISFGPEAPEDLGDQIAAVGDEACIPSEKCDWRTPPGEPDEPCSLTGPGAGVCF